MSLKIPQMIQNTIFIQTINRPTDFSRSQPALITGLFLSKQNLKFARDTGPAWQKHACPAIKHNTIIVSITAHGLCVIEILRQ